MDYCSSDEDVRAHRCATRACAPKVVTLTQVRYFVFSVAFLVTVAAQVLAQVKSPAAKLSEAQQPYVLRQSVEEVLLYCTVIDRKGRPHLNPDRGDFTVLEDGKRAAIVHFAKDDVPVSISLVLDDSKSMSEKRPIVQSAALALVNASNPDDETSITNFADKEYVDQDLTGDISALLPSRICTDVCRKASCMPASSLR